MKVVVTERKIGWTTMQINHTCILCAKDLDMHNNSKSKKLNCTKVVWQSWIQGTKKTFSRGACILTNGGRAPSMKPGHEICFESVLKLSHMWDI